ncbi:MAG: carbohydrate kinase family protein [Chloroflexota bacterium]|nr:MAG: carbohydrate kinase family protein [Chloroflexota bacterium]
MKIILTGSVAFDYLMRFPGYFRDHILPDQLATISLSFLVESMVRLRGGIAPNIAYTLALLGEHPKVMATVGEDFEEYRTWLESKGIDTTLMKVIPNEFSASFFANTDLSNSQISSFYPGAMAYASQLSFRDLSERPDLVVISPNDPLAMDRYVIECHELEIPYLYDPSQQIVRLSADELVRGIEGAQALFVNQYEFSLIGKITGKGEADILKHVRFLVVTCGQDGAKVFVGDETYHAPIVPPVEIIDPTGVGDAFRGGFLTGFSNGMDWEVCGRMGSLAATYCLEQRGPQGHAFTRPEFVSRYRKHFDDRGQLDILIKT